MNAIPRSLLESFRYIRFGPEPIDASLVPDFMIIGPNRTGSTWLHSQLSIHPELHFATPKEIFYFDALNLPDHPLHQSDDLSWYLSHFRMTPEIARDRQTQCRTDFQVDFTPRRQGEASASYAAGIGPERITDLIKLNPNLRAIILIRHPVDRAWSHVRFDARMIHKLDPMNLSDSQLSEVLHGDRYIVDCGRYRYMLELWERHLKPGHLLPIVFDRLTNDLPATIRDVAAFLDVSTAPHLFAKQAGYGIEPKEAPIPTALADELRQIYEEEMAFLRERFAVSWR